MLHKCGPDDVRCCVTWHIDVARLPGTLQASKHIHHVTTLSKIIRLAAMPLIARNCGTGRVHYETANFSRAGSLGVVRSNCNGTLQVGLHLLDGHKLLLAELRTIQQFWIQV